MNQDQLINALLQGVADIVNYPIPDTLLKTEIASPVNNEVGVFPLIVQGNVELYEWESYNISTSHPDQDYYLKKLFPCFKKINGDNRFQLIKSSAFIHIKDGSKTIFRCPRQEQFHQRNLYLEFYACGYDCELWVDTYLNNHNMNYQATS